MPEPEPTSNEPVWTTGQGIGFLVALPGIVIAVAAIATMLVALGLEGDERLIGLASAGGGGVLGLGAAVPGLIVFFKCRRPT